MQTEYDVKKENERALKSACFPAEKESFLADSSRHILALTAKILGHPVTKSDDEWSIALMAVSEAVDSYDPERGDFWSYAAIVIKSRLLNMYRKERRSSVEIPVSPDIFEGEIGEDDPDLSMKLKVREELTLDENSGPDSLIDEINALTGELEAYGISFFDLTKCSPRASKTRRGCAEVIASVFLPPPLVEYLRKKKVLPSSELQKRSGQSIKFLDKFRKYLIATTLILDGDYPQIAEYVEDMRPE